MRLSLTAGPVLLALAATPAGLLAQDRGTSPIAPNAVTLAAAAELRLPPARLWTLEAPAGAVELQRSSGDKRQGEILMLVGAAGIVTGLLVDEDIVTIAGAAVGGFGLYLYLQATR